MPQVLLLQLTYTTTLLFESTIQTCYCNDSKVQSQNISSILFLIRILDIYSNFQCEYSILLNRLYFLTL